MPSGKLRKVIVESKSDSRLQECESDIDPDYVEVSESSSEDEVSHSNLLEGKKPETMLEIIELLIDRGGISVENMLGVSNTIKLITEAKSLEGKPLNSFMRDEMGSCINLIILIANLYLSHMEKQKIPTK